jgi:hypothetical protein
MSLSRIAKVQSYGAIMVYPFRTIGIIVLQICVLVNNFGLVIVSLVIIDALFENSSSRILHLGVWEKGSMMIYKIETSWKNLGLSNTYDWCLVVVIFYSVVVHLHGPTIFYGKVTSKISAIKGDYEMMPIVWNIFIVWQVFDSCAFFKAITCINGRLLIIWGPIVMDVKLY